MLGNNVLIVDNVKVYLIFLNTTIWLIYSWLKNFYSEEDQKL